PESARAGHVPGGRRLGAPPRRRPLEPRGRGVEGMMAATMRRRVRGILPTLLMALVIMTGGAGAVRAQSQPAPSQPAPGASGPVSSAPMTALVEQLLDLFPRFGGEVLEVRGDTLTLGAGVRAGARAGLEVELFREGREIKHPRTGEVLGRAEDVLGTARITQAQ